MKTIWLALLIAVSPVGAAEGSGGFSSLLNRVTKYLNAPRVKRARGATAVAAVRGGIPTDQGEDLDGRLLDRARVLREALKRPDASMRDENALRPIYEALAASQFVQALSIEGAPEASGETAEALITWAKAPHNPGLPAGVISLLTGPTARINDKELVKAGWGRHARLLAPTGASARTAVMGWTAGEDSATLDETLKSLSDSWLNKKLDAESEARAHFLAGQVYAALAQADLKGRAPAAASSQASAPDEDAPAPAEAAVPFEPKAIYQKTSKSVVLIVCAAATGSGELGTGSVVDAGRRRILTNAHVVIQDSTRKPWARISIYFKPAKMTGDAQRDLVDAVEGKVIAWDRALDLALVEVSRLPAGTGAIALGHPGAVEVGDRVAAIGHPEQGGLWTLTTGVISTQLADLGGVKGKNAFQTDTSINRGNSGGPLLDASGRLVGINTSMSRKAADGLAITSINFAVRSDVAKRWMSGQGEKLAYGNAGAISIPASMMAKIPEPVPAPAAAVPVAAPVPAAPPAWRAEMDRAGAGSSGSSLETPAPAKPKPTTKSKTMMITESKPFTNDAVIEAEMAKMDDLGDEMHEEIKRRSK